MKENNLTDFLTDVADAIREKKGTTDKINPQDFSDEIKSIKTSTSSSMWTGHVDVEGLKAIGWDDEDIAYFQEHGVNWMEEDDEYHKVSDDNKALYGILTADNIQEYKNRIMWLPKIDFSKKTSLAGMFQDCQYMKGIPSIDVSNSGNFRAMFRGCKSLTCLPNLNILHATTLDDAFRDCVSLREFNLDLPSDASKLYMLYYSPSLLCIKPIFKGNYADTTFNYAYSLRSVFVYGLQKKMTIHACLCLSKTSILYMIKNEAATEPIAITLHADVYARLATDPDIVAALENHPLVSLASA